VTTWSSCARTALVGVVAGDPIMARTALASLRPTWDVPPAPSNRRIVGKSSCVTTRWLTLVVGQSGPRRAGRSQRAFATAVLRREATYTTAYIRARAP